MTCGARGFENPPALKFCGECGAGLGCRRPRAERTPRELHAESPSQVAHWSRSVSSATNSCAWLTP